MNKDLNKNGFYYPYEVDENIIKDDRFVSPFLIDYGSMSLVYSGYIYNMNELDDEYINNSSMIHTGPVYLLNG